MIKDIIEIYSDDNIITADGFDDAIIGIDLDKMRVIYSFKKCIQILCKQMSENDAVEYFYFNVSGSYIGEKTPIWCMDDFN
jgi:hypothetical protein